VSLLFLTLFRSGVEALVKRLKRKRASLATDIDSLWETTLAGGTAQRKARGLKKGKPDWREVIVIRISDAIDSNSSFHETLIAGRPKVPLDEEEVDHVRFIPTESPNIEDDSVPQPESRMNISEKIAQIEAEAKKLAAITFPTLGAPLIAPSSRVSQIFSDFAKMMVSSFIQHALKDQLAIVQRTLPEQSVQCLVSSDAAPLPAGEAVFDSLILEASEETERRVDSYRAHRSTHSLLRSWKVLHQQWRVCRHLRLHQKSQLSRAVCRLREYSELIKSQHLRDPLESYFLKKNLKKLIRGFRDWRTSASDQVLLKRTSILKIQCVGRRFLAQIRVKVLRDALTRRENTIRSSALTREKLGLQRALRKMASWRIRCRTLRHASLAVRARQLLPIFAWWKKLSAQARIAYAIRQSLARSKVKSRREKAVLLGEYSTAIPCLIAQNRTRQVFLHWRVLRVINTIFRLTYSKALKTKVAHSLERWKSFTASSVAHRIRMATKIQSTFRTHLSKKHTFNFYLVRRGMVALQCLARQRIATDVVALARKRHFSAIALQKIIRGYTFRIQLRRKRIQDIHEAAKSNNYERLLHYCDCFYNLTFQLDEEGNTALHNAAKYASKRCIKLLMKYYHDPSVTNPEGYTPLHLLIISAAPARDEVFEYMIEVGFDEDQLTMDGKNALLLASEYGRVRIANQCLKGGQDPNQRASDGSTPLQYACHNGYEALVKCLLEQGADSNLPGNAGLYPLHDVTYCGSMDIARQLIQHGASLDVNESVSGWTPLMMACRSGLEEMVDLFLAQAPDILTLDFSWCNAAHHCAVSNSVRIANSLREVEVDFYALDYEGNSPLHYAAQYGSVDVMREFLHSGAPASLQNHHGNQPSHIAAQYNQVECLKLLSRYDQHIGRMNYQHQTPLGMAKFHLATESRKFLEDYFSKIDGGGLRNEAGDIWWDREIDLQIGDWKQIIDEANHRHFVNLVTGEISLEPPAISTAIIQQIAENAQIEMKMKVLPQEEENLLNRKIYQSEYEVTQNSINEARKVFRSATVITKFARRKLAYHTVANKRLAIKRLEVLGRFVRRATDVLMKWKIIARTKKWIRVQAMFRGYSLRCHFYYWDGTYQYLWYELAKRRLARTIWILWRNYKLNLLQTTVHVAATAPRLLSDWEKILDVSGYPLRVVGLYEEYLYPGTKKILFYRNIETGVISFHKPKEIEKKDLMDYRAKEMYHSLGYTPAQLRLALKLQALWRGHKIRSMYVFITRATSMCLHAESKFLKEPDSDRNLFNYTLYCHVVLNDYDRARPLYIEALRRMTFKGPDVAQILYAYAIFAFVVHDEDVHECLDLVARGRAAEILHYNSIRKQQQRAAELSGGKEGAGAYVDIEITVGKAFELANVGFLRYMCNLRGNSDAFHNYAACRFLVYSDFPGAFDAFMGAFKSDPMNRKLRVNYDAMMIHFFGRNQNLIDEEVNRRMRLLAEKDHEEKMARQERVDLWNHKVECASAIQV
jgi:ankyrin repeat protein